MPRLPGFGSNRLLCAFTIFSRYAAARGPSRPRPRARTADCRGGAVMSASHNRPILVTGSQRSGSTWVGQMLASHPRVVYFWEPFNRMVPRSPVKYWYHHVTDED